MGKRVLYLAKVCLGWALLCSTITTFAQNITISVNATQNKRLISPYIYGKNDFLDHPVQFYKDAGLRFARMNGGTTLQLTTGVKNLRFIPTGLITFMVLIGMLMHRKLTPAFPTYRVCLPFSYWEELHPAAELLS